MKSDSLTRPVIGLYAVRIVLLAAVFVTLLLSVLRLQSDVNRTHSAANLAIDAAAVNRSAASIQAAVRGYLLVRQSSYLVAYAGTRIALERELTALRGATGNLAKAAKVRKITSEIASYTSDFAAPMIAGAGHLRRSELERLLGRGGAVLSTVGNQLSQLESTALAIRRRQRSSLIGVVALASGVAAAGLILSLTLDFWISAFLLRGILRPIRRVAEAAAAMARGELDARVPSGGRGEVALLASSFNEMARSTEARTSELASTQERLGQALAVAEEASAMKSNFVANMSHEVRTPLNGLMGMLSLLSETALSDEQRKYVDVAMSSSDALMHVVGDVLDIAKIEAGRLELEWIDFDLHEAVESVCELMAAAARSKRLELQSFVHDDLPRAVRGDRTRICQILQNLVSNAIKFTPAGEVAVEVSLRTARAGSIDVRFEVRDTGIGIEPQRVGQLFEPFTQAEAGTTRKFGGTGLGLAISRELAQLMHGTISGESSLGQGSTFSFEIPLQPAQAALPVPLPTAELSGVRVLVVDDNATNRRVFQSYVGSWGMRAQASVGAADAVAALRAAARAGDPFQIALLDLNLEGESGLDLARQINHAPELDGTRLIMLSSSGGTRSDDVGSGIVQRLTKPVGRSRLLEAITTALGEVTAGPDVAAARSATGGQRSRPAASARSGSGGGGRILVAEDHDVNWMLIERMLSTRGHTPERAMNGDAALEMLDARPYDLVLMDCQMPVRDGYDTTRELRRRGAQARVGARPVPVVAMTASTIDETWQQCAQAGMDGYLGKPILSDALDRVLERWLPNGAWTEGNAGRAEDATAGDTADLVADQDASGAVIGTAELERLRRLYPGEQLPSVIAEIVQEVSEDLAALTAGIEAADQARIATAAHRIRNAGYILGAARLVDAVAELDHPPREDRPPLVFDEQIVARLQSLWSEVRRALSELSRST